MVRDLHRIRQLRALAGANVELMVDANGGYSPGQARRVGAALDELGVTWFEEPISSDDTSGLGLLRQALRCDIAAGEYVSDIYDTARLAPVVDCLQLDATRCGVTPGGCAAPRSPPPTTCRCPPTAPPLCTSRWRRPCPTCATSSTSSTTSAWNRCSCKAYRNGVLHVNTTAPGHGMTLNPVAEEHVVN